MEEALLSNKKRDRPDGNKASRSGGVPEFVDLTRPSAAANADSRHVLSGYAALLNLINEKSDEIGKAESKKFMSIMDEFDQMHQFVEKPRDQVRDAEALLGLTGSLEASIRSQTVGGITPADFVSALLEGFGGGRSRIASKHILWKEIGVKVSSIFQNGRGCSTMLGPMKIELKQRKVAVRRKRTIRIRSTKAQPKELDRAKIMLTEEEKYRKGFKYDHVWNILKDIEKFGNDNIATTTMKSTNISSSQSATAEVEFSPYASPPVSSFNINITDDDIGDTSTKRPIGMKQAKGKRKKKDVSKIILQNKELVEQLKVGNEIRKQREENKILLKDLNSIPDPIMREFFRGEQLKIMQKRSQGESFQSFPRQGEGSQFNRSEDEGHGSQNEGQGSQQPSHVFDQFNFGLPTSHLPEY